MKQFLRFQRFQIIEIVLRNAHCDKHNLIYNGCRNLTPYHLIQLLSTVTYTWMWPHRGHFLHWSRTARLSRRVMFISIVIPDTIVLEKSDRPMSRLSPGWTMIKSPPPQIDGQHYLYRSYWWWHGNSSVPRNVSREMQLWIRAYLPRRAKLTI